MHRPPRGSDAGSAALVPADAGRYQALVQEHFDAVWRTLRGLGVPAAGIDDAAQQVFLVALRKLAMIRPGSERAFLLGTAVGVAANARRSVTRAREDADPDALVAMVDPRPDPEQAALISERRAIMQLALDALPDDLRTVFVLFELEGLTAIEIGETLAIPDRHGDVSTAARQGAVPDRGAARPLAPTAHREAVMSEPRRFVEGESSIERDLVEAWTSMRAPADARARALALGGVAFAATSAAAAKSAAASTIGHAAGVAAPSAAAPAASLGMAKLVAAVGLAAAVGGGAAAVASGYTPKTDAPVTVSSSTRVDRREAEPAAPPSAKEGVPVDELPPALPAPRRTSGGGARSATTVQPSPLATQLALIDAARDALAAGDARLALRELDAFDAKYPMSPLAEEAAALRVDALVAAGDAEGGARAARAFLTRWPESPYAARLRRVADEKP